jgi:hypothetical protein
MKPLLLFLLNVIVFSAIAQPDFTNAFDEGSIRLYRDIKQTNLYYYLPGNISLGYSASGKPDITFLMMRYTGTSTYNDQQQKVKHRNVVTMRMVMQPPKSSELLAVRKTIESKTGKCELRPLPLTNIESMIVFTPLNAQKDTTIVEKGELSAEGQDGYANTGEYWQERYFTIFPDDYTANLLNEALTSDRTVISFTYAFYSKGKSDKSAVDIRGYGTVSDVLKKQLNDEMLTNDSGELKKCLVKADAFTIRIPQEWLSQAIKKIDVNEAVPPGYAVLNIRNYDFANHLREDLYEKTLDLEAQGAGGDKVLLTTSFSNRNPDVSSINFRFKYAVRLDKPYRYRVHQLLKDGTEVISDWTTVSEWSPLLDITTKPI